MKERDLHNFIIKSFNENKLRSFGLPIEGGHLFSEVDLKDYGRLDLLHTNLEWLFDEVADDFLAYVDVNIIELKRGILTIHDIPQVFRYGLGVGNSFVNIGAGGYVSFKKFIHKSTFNYYLVGQVNGISKEFYTMYKSLPNLHVYNFEQVEEGIIFNKYQDQLTELILENVVKLNLY